MAMTPRPSWFYLIVGGACRPVVKVPFWHRASGRVADGPLIDTGDLVALPESDAARIAADRLRAAITELERGPA